MKKEVLLPILFTISVFAFTACINKEKQEIVIPNSISNKMVGEWNWIKTDGGWTGLQTPAKLGYTEKIEFGNDNSYKFFKNGQLIEERFYYLDSKPSLFINNASILYLNFTNKAKRQKVYSQPVYFIGNDTIKVLLAESCFDCPETYFVRKNVIYKNK